MFSHQSDNKLLTHLGRDFGVDLSALAGADLDNYVSIILSGAVVTALLAGLRWLSKYLSQWIAQGELRKRAVSHHDVLQLINFFCITMGSVSSSDRSAVQNLTLRCVSLIVS